MPVRRAIGLDIGTSGVRAAELSYDKHGVTLERFGQVALPSGVVRDGEVMDQPLVVEALKDLWKGSRLRSRDVFLGVANQSVVVRQVDLPPLAPVELKKALPFLVQEYLPTDVADNVLDFHATEEVDDGGNRSVRGLLVAASRQMVMSNVRAVEAAGLRAAAVDLTSFAVLRALGRPHGDVATEALLDVGARVSNLVVHSGGQPRFVRVLLRGGQDVSDAIAEALGIPAEEAELYKRSGAAGDVVQRHFAAKVVDSALDAFVDEVRSSIAYYTASQPSFPVERIVLSGGGSLLDGLAERLAAATRLDVTAGNPLSLLNIGRTGLDGEQLQQVEHLAAVPVGLALGAIS